MPILRRSAEPAAPLDPSQWRPQPYGHGSFRSVQNPVIEPAWGGLRVLARLSAPMPGQGHVVLTDENGTDCTAEFGGLATVIGAATQVGEAIVDGFLTIEPTQETEGVSLAMPESPIGRQLVTGLFLGNRVGGKPADQPSELDQTKPIAFVAVDLLSLDGTSLLDLPLLERKRLLETVLEVGELVRITPYVRPPIGSQAMSWRALGFRELVYKPSNGRYRTDGRPGDWAIAPIRTR